MNGDIAVQAENLSKTFMIPHENVDTIRERVFRFGRKRTFETFHALDSISFTVGRGEFFGIIGRNGSGKSTLLKILAGIYTPDSGKVAVNGEVSPFLELGVGFNPELSGRDNIFLNATILGLRRSEIIRKFDEIVAFSELERFLDQKLKNYSSGMQVRLAFSVAIHANKGILLMDEVLAVGDTNFQSKCISEFIRFKQAGNTVILVTHDTGTVQKYCDRAMLLRNGILEQIGDTETVTAAYICQNMTDEEKRRYGEKRREAPMDEKGGNGDETAAGAGMPIPAENAKAAEITGIEFMSRDREKRSAFQQGDNLVMRLFFKKFPADRVLTFEVSLLNREGNLIFCVNSKNGQADIKKILEQGFVELEFANLQLGNNTYYFSARIMDENASGMLDAVPRTEEFTVVSNSLNSGIVHLDHRWM